LYSQVNLIMLERILLEPEQKELLTTLVEATRNVKRREKFLVLETNESTWLRHAGLSGNHLEVYDADLEVLGNERLIALSYGTRGVAPFDVTPLGFRYYEYLKQQLGHPIQRVEISIHNFLEADVFRQTYPLAYQKWAEAEKLLWSTDSEQQLTTIGHLCREAIQEFVTALVERYKPSGVTYDKAKIIARTKAVLAVQSKKQGDRVEKFLEALTNYLGTTHDLIQRQEHGGQKEGEPLVWEDARRVVFNTAMVMFELDHALS